MNKKLIIIFSISIILDLTVAGQVNTDSIFNVAVQASSKSDYKNALVNIRKVCEADPSRYDALIFEANLFAWQKNYDSARYFISKAYNIHRRSTDLYDAWLNILMWAGEDKELLNTISLAQDNGYSNDYNILVKRVVALKNLGKYSEALKLCEEEKNKPMLDSARVMDLYQSLLVLSSKNSFTFYYSLDYLNAYDPPAQHLASAGFSHSMNDLTVILRANYASRFNKSDFQLESDLYYTLHNKNYIYANYGYSFNSILFPVHRAGAEYFATIRGHFEISAGARYLYFPGLPTGLLTGSLSTHLGPLQVSLKPYYGLNKKGSSFAIVTDLRRYGKTEANYWNLGLGYGNSPDERFLISADENYLKLSSYRLKLDRNISVPGGNELKLSAGYAYVEYNPGNFTNRFSIEIVFRLRIR